MHNYQFATLLSNSEQCINLQSTNQYNVQCVKSLLGFNLSPSNATS